MLYQIIVSKKPIGCDSFITVLPKEAKPKPTPKTPALNLSLDLAKSFPAMSSSSPTNRQSAPIEPIIIALRLEHEWKPFLFILYSRV